MLKILLPEAPTIKRYEELCEQYEASLSRLNDFHRDQVKWSEYQALLQEEGVEEKSSPLSYFDGFLLMLPIRRKETIRKIEESYILKYKIERLRFTNKLINAIIELQNSIHKDNQKSPGWYKVGIKSWLGAVYLAQHLLNKEEDNEDCNTKSPLFKSQRFIDAIQASRAHLENPTKETAKKLMHAANKMHRAVINRVPCDALIHHERFIGILMFIAGVTITILSSSSVVLAPFAAPICMFITISGSTIGGTLMGVGLHKILTPPPKAVRTDTDKKLLKASAYTKFSFFKLAEHDKDAEHPSWKPNVLQKSFVF